MEWCVQTGKVSPGRLDEHKATSKWIFYSLEVILPGLTHLLCPYLRKFIPSVTPKTTLKSLTLPAMPVLHTSLDTHQAQYNTQTTGKWLTWCPFINTMTTIEKRRKLVEFVGSILCLGFTYQTKAIYWFIYRN